MAKKPSSNEIVGKVYGLWTVLGVDRSGKGHKLRCRCECGTEKLVDAITVRNGASKSCGCVKKKPKDTVFGDKSKIVPKAMEDLRLIGNGYLPGADLMLHDGTPTWSLESIAKMLEISRTELMGRMAWLGPRFSPDMQKEEPAGGWNVTR